VLRLHHLMNRRPLFTIGSAMGELGLTYPTVSSAVRAMQGLGMVDEVTGRGRDRIFTYREYLSVLNEGTELPPLS